MKVNWREVIKVVVAIAIPVIGGFVVSFFAGPDNDDWYENLNFPSFRPPNWLFFPVWTILYTAMGVASYLVYRYGDGIKGEAQVPLLVYAVTLLFNWAWSPIFFGAKDIVGGLIDIIALTTSVTICAVLFAKVNKVAGALFVPYILWVSFASFLNYTLYDLNPNER